MFLKNFKLKHKTGTTYNLESIDSENNVVIYSQVDVNGKLHTSTIQLPHPEYNIIQNTTKKVGEKYIWEGDIVKARGMGEGTICWDESKFQWGVKITESPGGSIFVDDIIPLNEYISLEIVNE